MSKLRIAHIIVQPVLVWDDGAELTQGPELGQISVPLSRLVSFAESLPDEIAALQAKIDADV
ncbi:hypothetical protein DM793_19720 [Paenarthrobacter nitroguajacolicus]|uniref:hypothetical protein n=1 Tax=Paenarthrobacter nitroguajacolicus TaxID=211146 RepID=UPI0015BE1FBB|nr:hypothetical protein [Paenarthrobacter nitroguajacolicus]NWL13496.1 hypothetical protein [Paenarthrobacter nitroguajacolicus]